MVIAMNINTALKFAYKKHTGQTRKITNEKYFFHPIEVSLKVAQYTTDEDTIVAAILHDTLEDTDTSEDEIKSIFGENILNIILECSEKDKSKEWKTRKIQMLKSYSTLSKEACLIILSDKICNLNNIYYHNDDNVWDYFNADKEEQKWLYESSLSILKLNHYDYIELYQELEQLVHKIFK